jgi:Leucine-rich repeat (LRR) protein
MFKHLINIESIIFRGSSIGSIQPGTFSSLLKLKQLDLGMNKLKKIPLNEMKCLEVLKLDSNEIVSIEELFESMEKLKSTTLKELGLQCNRLGKLEADSFDCAPSLETLYLGGNTILAISDRAFNSLNNLKVLYISWPSRNEWPRISGSFDKNEPFLHIEDNTFSSLRSLRTLSLSTCKIQAISNQTFNGLVNLHTLNLSHNNLRRLDDNAFSFLSSLAHLDLSYNKLEAISKSAFNGLVNLIGLNLSSNEFESIDMCVFFNSDLDYLRRLNLNSQKLKVIELSDSKTKFSHLRHQLVVQINKSSQVQICSLLDKLVVDGFFLFEK